VEFKRPIKVGKVFLPALQEFALTMHQIDAISASDFMAHLFFYRNYTTQENTIKGMSISVRSEADEKYLFYGNLRATTYLFDSDTENSYPLSLEGFNYDVTCYFYYDALALRPSIVYPTTIRTSDLKKFSIFADNFHPDIFEALKSMHQLTALKVVKNTAATVSIDLSTIPTIESIQYLVFGNLNIGSSRWIDLKNLSKLEMYRGQLNLTQISLSNSPSNIEVRLQNTVLIGSNLNSVVRNIQLRRLDLDYRPRQIPFLEFDLKSLQNSSQTLSSVDLSGLDLKISESKSFQMDTKYILLRDCKLSENLLQDFPDIFPNLHHFSIYQYNASRTMFQDMLQFPHLRFLAFDRSDHETPEVNQFMLDSNIPKNAYWITLNRSNETVTGWNHLRSSPLNSKLDTKLRDTALYTYILILSIIIGVGIIGNILSAIVLTRKNMRSSTSCILLGLAFCDTPVLITYACSTLYFGIKFIFVFLKFKIVHETDVYTVSEQSVKWLDQFYYSFMYPLNKTGETFLNCYKLYKILASLMNCNS